VARLFEPAAIDPAGPARVTFAQGLLWSFERLEEFSGKHFLKKTHELFFLALITNLEHVYSRNFRDVARLRSRAAR
jgi:hypothetical protein